jgi:hypothetical protein
MWRKRGRPKKIISKLNKSKNQGIVESLDLCLQKKIITSIEHASAMKLRWIYTLRFGAPTLQSKLKLIDSYSAKNYDEQLLQDLQKKYRNVIAGLRAIYAHKIVMDVCIFNEFPTFLIVSNLESRLQEKFLQGMELLTKEFSKS